MQEWVGIILIWVHWCLLLLVGEGPVTQCCFGSPQKYSDKGCANSKNNRKRLPNTLIYLEIFSGNFRVNVKYSKNLLQVSTHETQSVSRQITQFLARNETMFTEKLKISSSFISSPPFAHSMVALLWDPGSRFISVDFWTCLPQPFQPTWLPRDIRSRLQFFLFIFE